MPAEDGMVIEIDGPDDGQHVTEGLAVFDEKKYLTTYVAFEKFGESSRVPVVGGLQNLLAAIYPVVGELWSEF